MRINKTATVGLGAVAFGAMFPLVGANASTVDATSVTPTVNVVDSETGDKLTDAKVEVNAFTRASAGDSWVNANNEKVSSTVNVEKLLEKFETKATNCNEATLKLTVTQLNSDVSHASDSTLIDLCKTVDSWVVDGVNKNVDFKDNTLTIKNASKIVDAESVAASEAPKATTDAVDVKESTTKDDSATDVASKVDAKTVTTKARAASATSTVAASTVETNMQAAGAGLSISGNVFKDANGDGNFNDKDKAYAGITVTLINDGTGNTVQTKKTDSKGNYTFSDVQGGVAYNVKVTKPSGSTFTRIFNDTVGSISGEYAQVDVGGDGSSVNNVDFGINVNDTNSNGNNSAKPTTSSTSTAPKPNGTTPGVVTLPSKTPTATKTSSPTVTVSPTSKPSSTSTSTSTSTPTTAATVDPCTKYSNEAEAAAAGHTCTTVSDSTIQTGELRGGVNKLALAEGGALLGLGGLMVRRAFRKNA